MNLNQCNRTWLHQHLTLSHWILLTTNITCGIENFRCARFAKNFKMTFPPWLNKVLCGKIDSWVVSKNMNQVQKFSFVIFSSSSYQTKSRRTPFSMNTWKRRCVIEYLLLDWPIGLHINDKLWDPKSLQSCFESCHALLWTCYNFW